MLLILMIVVFFFVLSLMFDMILSGLLCCVGWKLKWCVSYVYVNMRLIMIVSLMSVCSIVLMLSDGVVELIVMFDVIELGWFIVFMFVVLVGVYMSDVMMVSIVVVIVWYICWLGLMMFIDLVFGYVWLV